MPCHAPFGRAACAASPPGGPDDRADPLDKALQPPWWDGGPYDVHETIGIIADLILDTAA